MDFSSNISDEEFSINDDYQSLLHDDVSCKQKNHLNSFDDNLGSTISNDIVHNDGDITDDFDLTMSQIMAVSQLFDMSAPDNIDTITGDVINQCEEQMMEKTDQKKNKKIVTRKSKLSKKVNMVKGKWTFSEDEKLIELVKQYGTKEWTKMAKMLNGRVGKQCRERWFNHLDPDLKKGPWTEEEDQILIEAHKVHGTKWIKIAKLIPGRSENTIKNRWNATKRQIELTKKKQSDANANPPRHNNLNNYIEHVVLNNNATETDGTTETNDTLDEINDTMDVGTQSTEQLIDPSTTSVYVPTPATFTGEENQFAGVYDPMDGIFTEMLNDWDFSW